jgi:hypothetical protein
MRISIKQTTLTCCSVAVEASHALACKVSTAMDKAANEVSHAHSFMVTCMSCTSVVECLSRPTVQIRRAMGQASKTMVLRWPFTCISALPSHTGWVDGVGHSKHAGIIHAFKCVHVQICSLQGRLQDAGAARSQLQRKCEDLEAALTEALANLSRESRPGPVLVRMGNCPAFCGRSCGELCTIAVQRLNVFYLVYALAMHAAVASTCQDSASVCTDECMWCLCARLVTSACGRRRKTSAQHGARQF